MTRLAEHNVPLFLAAEDVDNQPVKTASPVKVSFGHTFFSTGVSRDVVFASGATGVYSEVIHNDKRIWVLSIPTVVDTMKMPAQAASGPATTTQPKMASPRYYKWAMFAAVFLVLFGSTVFLTLKDPAFWGVVYAIYGSAVTSTIAAWHFIRTWCQD